MVSLLDPAPGKGYCAIVSSLVGEADRIVAAPSHALQFGARLAQLRDMNGDGRREVVVGSRLAIACWLVDPTSREILAAWSPRERSLTTGFDVRDDGERIVVSKDSGTYVLDVRRRPTGGFRFRQLELREHSRSFVGNSGHDVLFVGGDVGRDGLIVSAPGSMKMWGLPMLPLPVVPEDAECGGGGEVSLFLPGGSSPAWTSYGTDECDWLGIDLARLRHPGGPRVLVAGEHGKRDADRTPFVRVLDATDGSTVFEVELH